MDLNSLFGNQKATIDLKLKALPVFNKEQGAIYPAVKWKSSMRKLSRKSCTSVVQTLIPYLNQSLRSYFNQQPAYVLREDASTGEALSEEIR